MTLFHWIGNALRYELGLVPLSVARWLMIGVFLALLLWIVQLPATETNPAEGKPHWTRDLKIWAWLALLFQVVIYSVF